MPEPISQASEASNLHYQDSPNVKYFAEWCATASPTVSVKSASEFSGAQFASPPPHRPLPPHTPDETPCSLTAPSDTPETGHRVSSLTPLIEPPIEIVHRSDRPGNFFIGNRRSFLHKPMRDHHVTAPEKIQEPILHPTKLHAQLPNLALNNIRIRTKQLRPLPLKQAQPSSNLAGILNRQIPEEFLGRTPFVHRLVEQQLILSHCPPPLYTIFSVSASRGRASGGVSGDRQN